MPTVLHNPSLIADLKPPVLSLDFEYSVRTSVPSIVGVSDAERTVCVPFDEGEAPLRELFARHPDAKWLGHNFCGAEAEILRGMGIAIRPEQIIDTIALHYLLNMNLCKS